MCFYRFYLNALIIVALMFSLLGCAHTVGYGGQHPGYIRCQGKGVITGTGAFAVGAGVGGGQANNFTLQAECGDGFVFDQGPALPAK